MKGKSLSLLFAILVCCPVFSAPTYLGGFFVGYGFPNEYAMSIGWTYDWQLPPPDYLISWDNITQADWGKTYYASAATFPDFQAVVDELTNGVSHSWTIYIYNSATPQVTGVWAGFNESDIVLEPGNDLKGYTIDYISMKVNPNFTTQWGIYGEKANTEIPAPAASLLVCIGAGFIGWLKRGSKIRGDSSI